jgi:hypothetical protein
MRDQAHHETQIRLFSFFYQTQIRHLRPELVSTFPFSMACSVILTLAFGKDKFCKFGGSYLANVKFREQEQQIIEALCKCYTST